MFKRKKNLIQTSSPKLSLWGHLKRRLISIGFIAHKKEASYKCPLEKIDIETLELQPLEPNRQAHPSPEIEITFVNPETGKLEVIHLPQEAFSVKVEESHPASLQEPVVLLELNMPNIKDKEEEDNFKKITHFPPSSRLH